MKTETHPLLQKPTVMPVINVEQIGMTTYEKLVGLSSDGTLTKRLFLCAQIFFNVHVTESDINAFN
jgi:hypothetical protein